VIGESGSGKSTLGLALAGLLPESAMAGGEIGWPGLGRTPRRGRDIGFVFQDAGASLNPVLTIGEQIAEVARRHFGLGWKSARDSAASLLDRVRIPNPAAALAAYPHQLSGGQRQRVAIAAAIAARPLLLIADEPTSALDTVVQADIVTLLETLVAEDGMTLVFITHDIALASGFADRIAVLRNARLVEIAPADEIVARPAAAYTRQLLAAHIGLDTPPLVADAPQ
jgi:peptide/nickel transport system ATP-binding protein